MAPPFDSDKRYLEKHGSKYRVVISVPKKLQKLAGTTKIKRDLGTDSLAVANSLKWQVIAQVKAELSLLDKRRTLEPTAFDSVALSLRQDLMNASSANEAELVRDYIGDKAQKIIGAPLAQVTDGDYVYDPHRESAADRFYHIATGKRSPLAIHRELYESQLQVQAKTKASDIRAFKLFADWCKSEGVEQFLEAIQKRHAVEFVDALPKLLSTEQPRTINKYVARLYSFWKWMASRDYVAINIWEGRKLPVPAKKATERERIFTDEELHLLFSGKPNNTWMIDLMKIAALSGARLGVIVSLTVGDCIDGCFRFKPQKKEVDYRFCPIHSDLIDLVSRRSEGKSKEEFLFHDAPRYADHENGDSGPASSAFSRYRIKLGIVDSRKGNRQGRIKFHSFRRWFVTQAERAGQPGHIISAVVGHKREGMTLGVYSAGPAIEQMRACVEAVRLPFP